MPRSATQTHTVKGKTPLTAFAAGRFRHTKCRVCTAVPKKVLAELDAGLRQGVPHVAVEEWLAGVHHIAISNDTIGKHERRCLGLGGRA